MAADASISFEISLDLGKIKTAVTSTAAKVNSEFTKAFSQSAKKCQESCDRMAGSFEKAGQEVNAAQEKIDSILSNSEKSMKSKAAQISWIYRKEGMAASDAMKKAWSDIERGSAASTGSAKKSILGLRNPFKIIRRDVKDIGDQASRSINQTNKIVGMVKKAGAALAAAFAVKKIVDFGAQCIKLGSDLQEVQNVVDVTFPRMQKQVNAFAQNAAASFGLSETMAKKFTGTFGAMAKAFGFNEQAAFEMSTALTGLSGDVASFYNISQDEAYTKLKSVFTGETESLKDLGVVMTQAALDQYALANGYGKTTQAMSEAEKVALRYKFVQEQLSLASGDFIRTSDGWANQVRILKLQFDSLKATIGQGLINVLTPVIKVINSIIGKLMSLANAFKAFTEMVTGKKSGGGTSAAAAGMEAMADSADHAGAAAGGAGGSAKKAAKDMKGMATGIDELNIVNAPDDGGGGGGSGGGAGGGYAADEFDMGELDTSAMDEMDSKYQKLIDKAKELANLFKGGFTIAFGDTSVLDSIQQSVFNIGQSLKGIFTDPEVLAAANNLFNSIVFNLGMVAGGIASMGASIADNLLGGINLYLTQNSERIKGYLLSMFDIASEVSDIIGRWFEAIGTVFEAFRSDSAKQITADIIGMFSEGFMGVTELASMFGADLLDAITAPFVENKDLIKQTLEDTFSAVAPIFSDIKSVINEFFTKAKATYDKYWAPMMDSLKTGLSEVADTMLNVYNQHILPVIQEMSERFSEFREQYLSPLIDKFMEFAGKVAEAVTVVWENCLKPLISWFIETMGPVIGEILSGAIDMFFVWWEGISKTLGHVFDALGGLMDFIKGVFTGDWKLAWEGIKAFLSSIWEAMKTIVSTVFNSICSLISTVLNIIKSLWEGIWIGIKTFVSVLWDGIKSLASTVFTAIKDKLSEIWNNIKQTIEDKWNGIKSFVGETWAGIKDSATQIFEAVRDKLSEIWDAVKSTIEEKWNAIKEWFAEIWNAIKDVFKLDEMLELGKNVMNKLWEGMESIWEDIAGWLDGIADAVGEAWDNVVNGAKNLFKRGKEEAESESESEEGETSKATINDSGTGASGPGIKGHATGGFPRSGQMFVAREDGVPEMIGSWGGKAAIANNQQITQGITAAVQRGMRASMAPLAATMGMLADRAAPPLAMVGSTGSPAGESQLRDLMGQAAAMNAGGGNPSEQYLLVMIDLLRKIVELIENLDLTVTFDTRDIKKKLADLEKRSGYTLKTT